MSEKLKCNPVQDFEQKNFAQETLRIESSLTRGNANVKPLIKLLKCI